MIESISAEIAAAAADARQQRGSSRDEAAAAARDAGAPATFTAAALRNLEAGRRCPSVDELLWLATALDVPVPLLLGKHAELFAGDPVPAAAELPGHYPAPLGCGAVQDETRRAVAQLGALTGRQRALAEIAYTLAGDLDGSGEKRQPSQLAKALTDTMTEIWQLTPVEADPDDGLGAE